MGIPFITRASFELEQLLGKTDVEDVVNRQHIFIAGLARAGTTLLLRRIHDSNAFRSLNYRDMPFPLMPGLWQKISAPFAQSLALRERAHGDNLMVNADSPEAFEEVFWRIFAGKRYIRDDRLLAMNVDDNLIELFRNYIATILASNNASHASRYLSKNNNNILRLSTIRSAFPEALIIIPFRDPLRHAASLHRQHMRFTQTYSSDRFAHAYMHWLGHFEFGMNQRPFIFSDAMLEKLSRLNPEEPAYWVELWTGVYRYLLDSGAENSAIFLGYERFCTDTDEVWRQLTARATIHTDVHASDAIHPAMTTPQEMQELPTPLREEAYAVHEELLARETAAFD